MKKTSRIVGCVLSALWVMFTVTGCSAGKASGALSRLCEVLHSDYTCKVSFSTSNVDNPISGTATLSHGRTITHLTLDSPDHLSGMNIEYDTAGLPSSVSIHFMEIDMELPKAALTRINSVASLAADDFVGILSALGAEDIHEYELQNDGTIGYYVTVPYDKAHITLCFSAESDMPYSMEYISPSFTANMNFEDFKVIYEEA